jgi:hypothetical protein
MKIYSKNRIFFIAITFLLLVYYSIDYAKSKETKEVKKCLIVDKRCSTAPSIKTYVKINFQTKTYIINTSTEDCENYIIGQKALFLYDSKNDFFIDKNYMGNNPFKIIILSVVFVILLIPIGFLNPKQ